MPISASAHLTGTGFGSINSFWCNGKTLLLSATAVAMSPAIAALHISAMARGATLAVTEILPAPPASIRAIAVGSSPEYTANDFGARRSRSRPRPMLPVASFTPTMFGICARRRMVSLLMSATVRPGTLYRITGKSTASAMALKCWYMPSWVGRL